MLRKQNKYCRFTWSLNTWLPMRVMPLSKTKCSTFVFSQGTEPEFELSGITPEPVKVSVFVPVSRFQVTPEPNEPLEFCAPAVMVVRSVSRMMSILCFILPVLIIRLQRYDKILIKQREKEKNLEVSDICIQEGQSLLCGYHSITWYERCLRYVKPHRLEISATSSRNHLDYPSICKM